MIRPSMCRGPAGLALLAAGFAIASTGSLSPGAAQTVAITNARIYTVSGGVIENGTVVFEGSRITAVGADVAPPAGARVIDGTGKIVTPGLIESSSQLGVVEIGAVSQTVDASSSDDRVTAAFRVSDGLNPFSTLIPVAATGGVTRAVVVPGGSALIVGQAALIDLDGDRPANLVTRDPLAMVSAFDQGAAGRFGGSHGAALMRLREALQDARDYAANRAAFDAGARRDYALSRLDLEALSAVVAGELPMIMEANRTTEIMAAIGLAQEFGFDLILFGAAEGWVVADAIQAAGVPVVTNPIENLPSYDRLAISEEGAGRLAGSGVPVAFTTGVLGGSPALGTHNVRNLRLLAGGAVRNGMAYADALRAITLTPAEIWGIADEAGSIEVGKAADLVVWSGDPFEPLSRAEHVFIGGQEMDAPTRQARLLERYRQINEALPEAYQR
ncbi:MAG TPA: amidohydrolase family protein [Longimicrobiales bacterium]|nr:amidohydrolase family protein [Longimicrobiales bacterium]